MELSVTQQTEIQYRLLVESVEDYGIFLLDTQGYIQTWNEGAYRIKGYTTSEIIGKHFSQFYPPEEIARGKPDSLLNLAIRQGHYEGEGWRLRKDGSRFWANVIITPVYNNERQLIGFSKITRDLTDRMQYENDLRASEREKRKQNQLLLTIIDHSPAGIALLEPIWNAAGKLIDFKFLQTNRANAALSGRSAGEFTGQLLKTLFPQVQSQQFWRQLVACVETGQPQPLTENYTGDGLNIWIDGLFVKQGEHVLWVFQDVTELKRVQLELEKKLAILQEAKQQVDIDLVRLKVAEQEVAKSLDAERELNTLKTEFVKLVSHQFRTPLTSISLQSEAIKRFSEGCTDRAFAQKVAEYCQQVGRDIHRLGKLISEVLTNERLQGGQIQIHRERLNLAEFCQQLIQQQQQQDPAYQRVNFRSDHSRELVWVDLTLLEPILENLLSNALKYSADSQKPVEVRLREMPAEWVVTVQDYGMGIPDDELKFIMQSFFRASNATHYPGTGLGLSLSHRLAQMQGGRLTIESKQNQYTLCHLSLPKYRHDQQALRS